MIYTTIEDNYVTPDLVVIDMGDYDILCASTEEIDIPGFENEDL